MPASIDVVSWVSYDSLRGFVGHQSFAESASYCNSVGFVLCRDLIVSFFELVIIILNKNTCIN